MTLRRMIWKFFSSKIWTRQTVIVFLQEKKQGIHIIAVQNVLCTIKRILNWKVGYMSKMRRLHSKIMETLAFVDVLLARCEEQNITAYVAMFIGAVYRHQERLETDKEQQSMYISNMLPYFFEVFQKGNEIKYFDVINENATPSLR